MNFKKPLLLLAGSLAMLALLLGLTFWIVSSVNSLYADNIQVNSTPASQQPPVQTPTPEDPDDNQSENEDETEVPTETFYDAEGNAYTLEDFKDRPIVVSLWSANKSKSTPNLDILEDAYQEYGDKIHFIVIHVSNDSVTGERGEERAREEGCTFPIYHDPSGVFLHQFENAKVPLTLYYQKGVDPIAYADVTLTKKSLSNGIKAILPQ